MKLMCSIRRDDACCIVFYLHSSQNHAEYPRNLAVSATISNFATSNDKTKGMKTRRIMMAVAMMLVCISSTAQEQRMMTFQTVMAMHDTTYKNLIKDGTSCTTPRTRRW